MGKGFNVCCLSFRHSVVNSLRSVSKWYLSIIVCQFLSSNTHLTILIFKYAKSHMWAKWNLIITYPKSYMAPSWWGITQIATQIRFYLGPFSESYVAPSPVGGSSFDLICLIQRRIDRWICHYDLCAFRNLEIFAIWYITEPYKYTHYFIPSQALPEVTSTRMAITIIVFHNSILIAQTLKWG